MSSRNRDLVMLAALAAVVGAAWGLRSCFIASAKRMPSYQRAHASVAQILFVQGRVLVRNEVSELFASDDNGRSWRTLAERRESLTVANGTEIWGAHGWAGHHERPSASFAHSADRGDTWSTMKVPFLRWDETLHARLPAAFINEPAEEPLLLMSDAQLVRPALVLDTAKWQRVGRAIQGPPPSRGTVNRSLAGRKHGNSIYVASAGVIYFSADDGMTWTSQRVHANADAEIRCRATTCYALVSETGSGPSGLMATELGTNDWKLIRTFDLDELKPILASERPITSFGATALLPAEAGVYVAGIVDAGGDAWGAALLVDNAGAVTRVGNAMPDGLWVLEQAPDGTVWAGGRGAYRLQADDWVLVWSAPPT